MLPCEQTETMRNVLLIAGGFFVLFFGFTSAQQYLFVIFQGEGRGDLALVTFIILYGVFAVSGLAASALISAAGGLKRSLLTGACTYILFIASIALNNVPFILVCAGLMGIGATLLWVSSGQMVVDSSTAKTRGRNLALQTMGLYGGTALGVWAGGFLYEAVSVQSMYLLLGGVMLLSLPFFVLTKPVKETAALRVFRPQFLFDHRMLLLVPVIVGAYFLQGQVFTGMNLLVIGAVGIGSLALVISVVRVCNIAGSLGIGILSDYVNKGIVLAGLVGIALAGIFVFTRAEDLPQILFGSVLLGFSMASIYPVCLSWLKEKMRENEYLDALGIFHVYSNVGTLAAFTANLWLPAGATYAPGIAALLIALPCILYFHRLKSHGV